VSRKNWPIIIGGFYRSGTSLLRRLLDTHSRIHCGPEVKFFKDFFGDYQDDTLAHVRFFRTLRTLGLEDEELLRLFGPVFIEAHQLAARKQNKPRWADKNPENVLYLDYWNILLRGQFYFVHIVRHPLDALASLVEIGFPKAVPADFDGKVSLYQAFLVNAQRFVASHPTLSLTLRYEDLVSESEKSLLKLLEAIGEEYEPGMLIDYNAPERQPGLEDPKIARSPRVHADSIGRWQRDLSRQQVVQARAVLAPLVKEYGYNV
jgi:hypothetical protein